MGKTAFIFPGQGAQKAGMGKDFYEKYDTAKDVFDSAGEWLDLDMKALCFEENDRLDLTEYTQAALVTTCLAMEKVVEEMGLHPEKGESLWSRQFRQVREAWQQLWEWRQRRSRKCLQTLQM